MVSGANVLSGNLSGNLSGERGGGVAEMRWLE